MLVGPIPGILRNYMMVTMRSNWPILDSLTQKKRNSSVGFSFVCVCVCVRSSFLNVYNPHYSSCYCHVVAIKRLLVLH